MTSANSCCAVCVVYFPEPGMLQRLYDAIIPQVKVLYIVNNGSSDSLNERFETSVNCQLIDMGHNAGVAAGLNAGVRAAMADGYEFVLLLDQDSVPPADIIDRFLDVYNQKKSRSEPVAILGPRYKDPKSLKVSKFIRFGWMGNTYRSGSSEHPVLEVDFLISSGAFIPLQVFDSVGLFQEGLFIDHVDTEWCHRAHANGYKMFGLWDVVMEHSHGEKRVRLWLLKWFYQPIHQPFRLYFITRNSFLLYRMIHVPNKWVVGDLFRLMRLIVMNILFSSRRLEAVCWFVLGVRDGCRGVDGPGPKKAE